MQEEKPHITVVPDGDLGSLQCCSVQCYFSRGVSVVIHKMHGQFSPELQSPH